MGKLHGEARQHELPARRGACAGKQVDHPKNTNARHVPKVAVMREDSELDLLPDPFRQVRLPALPFEMNDELVVRVYEYTLAHEPATICQASLALRIPAA